VSSNQAKEVWQQAGMWDIINRLDEIVTGIKAFVFTALTTLDEMRKCDFVMLLWCLWKHINDKV
jgi:hypothetical protein